MVCYEGNEDGFWLLWIVAAVGFCAFAIFVPAVLAEILYKANRPAPASQLERGEDRREARSHRAYD